MSEAPTPRPGPETGPSNGPPPNPALARSNPGQAAEQLMRLTLSPSSTVDDIIRRLYVPFCGDIILSNADDLRIYVDSILNSNIDTGRNIVGVVDTQIISQVNFNDARWFLQHNDRANQIIAQCVRNGIASPSDHMVTVCVRMMDLQKEALAEIIVDKQSRLIKLVACSAPRCRY
jgi:hypothetical protein